MSRTEDLTTQSKKKKTVGQRHREVEAVLYFYLAPRPQRQKIIAVCILFRSPRLPIIRFCPLISLHSIVLGYSMGRIFPHCIHALEPPARTIHYLPIHKPRCPSDNHTSQGAFHPVSPFGALVFVSVWHLHSSHTAFNNNSPESSPHQQPGLYSFPSHTTRSLSQPSFRSCDLPLPRHALISSHILHQINPPVRLPTCLYNRLPSNPQPSSRCAVTAKPATRAAIKTRW